MPPPDGSAEPDVFRERRLPRASGAAEPPESWRTTPEATTATPDATWATPVATSATRFMAPRVAVRAFLVLEDVREALRDLVVRSDFEEAALFRFARDPVERFFEAPARPLLAAALFRFLLPLRAPPLRPAMSLLP